MVSNMNTIHQLLQSSDQLIQGMSNDEYHARPEYSSSQLKDLLRSAAHFYSINIAKEHERETKKHLDFGTLAHALFLEPQVFESEFCVLPADAPKPPTDVMRNAKNPSADSIARVQWWDAWKAENGKKITITKDQLDSQIIPNEQQLFYFNEDGNDYQTISDILPSISRASDKNRIVVVLDTDWMTELEDSTLAANVINNGLFSPEAVSEIAQLSQTSDFSINPIAVYQTVALKVQSLEHQLLMATILQKLILLILILCVYQYAKTLIAARQSDFVKMIILGRSKVAMSFSCLMSLISLIVVSICLTVQLTGQTELFLLVLVLFLIIIISSVRSFWVLSKNYAQILKGELSWHLNY